MLAHCRGILRRANQRTRRTRGDFELEEREAGRFLFFVVARAMRHHRSRGELGATAGAQRRRRRDQLGFPNPAASSLRSADIAGGCYWKNAFAFLCVRLRAPSQPHYHLSSGRPPRSRAFALLPLSSPDAAQASAPSSHSSGRRGGKEPVAAFRCPYIRV